MTTVSNAALVERVSEMLAAVPPWLATLRLPEAPYGRYRYYPSSSRPWCLYASFVGLSTEELLGQQWTEQQRREALSLFDKHQSAEDHFFHCPVCPADDSDPVQRCQETPAYTAGMSKKMFNWLQSIGHETPYPPPAPENMIPDDVEGWLEQTFEEAASPYGAGSRIGHLVGTRSLGLKAQGKDPLQDPKIQCVHQWLFEHQDESGFFRAGDDLENGMNGLLKMRFGVFESMGKPIPKCENIVRSILSLQKDNGGFGASCGDWNASTLLFSCGGDMPQYREAIRDAYERVVERMAQKQKPDGGFAWDSTDQHEANLTATNVHVQALTQIRRFLQGGSYSPRD
jgi:hypothetical protein